VDTLEAGCAAPVCNGSQGVPGQWRIATAFCFFDIEWEVYYVAVVVHERGSWALRWGYCSCALHSMICR
jgi:hypothetical protein